MAEFSKIKSLQEAVECVCDGMHIALSGFTISRNAIAVAHELMRQNKKKLTISACIGAMDSDLLVGAGAVSKLIYGGGSLDRFGRLQNINRAIEQGTIEVDELSGFSMAMRFLAGSLGIPYIPIQSLFGSDILKNLLDKPVPEVTLSECPFTQEKVVLLKALQPDYAFIHVAKADCEGNALIYGPRWDEDAAKAANHIVIVADEIISTEMTPLLVDQVVIPSCRVSMVVQQPYGAHPTSLYGVYDYDHDHLAQYVSAAQTPEGMRDYLNRYVFGVKDFYEYLELVGGFRKLNAIKADLLKKY